MSEALLDSMSGEPQQESQKKGFFAGRRLFFGDEEKYTELLSSERDQKLWELYSARKQYE